MLNSVLRLRSHAQLRMRAHGVREEIGGGHTETHISDIKLTPHAIIDLQRCLSQIRAIDIKIYVHNSAYKDELLFAKP